MHAHSGPIDIKKAAIKEELNVAVREGDGIYYPNLIYPLKNDDDFSQMGHVWATITTQIPYLGLKELSFLPLNYLMRESGVKMLPDETIQETLTREMKARHPNKENVNWITFELYEPAGFHQEIKTPENIVDVHFHFAEPIKMDGDVFLEAEIGSLTFALQEGFHSAKVEGLNLVQDISERLLGEGQEILKIRTRIAYLKQLKSLFFYEMLRDAGYLSAELTRRMLYVSQNKKGRDADWISIVFFLVARKFERYACPKCKKEKLSLEAIGRPSFLTRLLKRQKAMDLFFSCYSCGLEFKTPDKEDFLRHPHLMYLGERYPQKEVVK
jgi:hypothetical protein